MIMIPVEWGMAVPIVLGWIVVCIFLRSRAERDAIHMPDSPDWYTGW